VRLAGEDQLHGPRLVAQQRQRAVDVAQQQVEPLVRRHAPREADREHVGVERVDRRAYVLGGVAAPEPVHHRPLADDVDQRGALRTPRRPQLLVGDRVERLPGRGVDRAVGPALAEIAVEQLAHRRADPGRDVRAVGDVRDRHVVDVAVGPQVLPHLARDLAVTLADGVGDPARAQRELRDAERLGVLLGVRASAAHERVRIDAQLGGDARQHLGHLRGRVRVVARRDRRVRGEDRPAAHRLERVVQGRRAARQLGARELEAGEGRVALVEVHDAGIDAQRMQRAHAADAEQRVLPQAHAGVAHVQARGDPAVREVVLRPVGIEQQQRHAPDVDAPDLRDDLALADRHGDRHGPAVVAGDERCRHALGIRLDPVLVLPAGGVDALAEVAVAVHQADRHQRQAHVGGLLEDVPREHAEPARVDGQRLVNGELGAEERGRALLGHRLGELRLGQAVGDRALELGQPSEEILVLGESVPAVGMHLLDQPDRISETQLPAPRIHGRQQLGAAGRPRPAVVVGDVRERAERLGQARAERGGSRPEIGRTCLHDRLS
jgi:hypothetical protein